MRKTSLKVLLIILLSSRSICLTAENINDPQEPVNKEFNNDVKGEADEQLFIQVMDKSRKNLSDNNAQGLVYDARAQHLCMQSCANMNKGQNCARQCSEDANRNYGAPTSSDYVLPVGLRPSGPILEHAQDNGKSKSVEYYLPTHP